MAKKIVKKGRISYVCEKCGNEMFKFIVEGKGLLIPDDPVMYKKYLNTENPNGPYYTCQFCNTIHKGYYINGGFNIDLRPLAKKWKLLLCNIDMFWVTKSF